MSREIKFRGMGVNGEWFYGNLNIITDKRVGVELGSYISNKVGMPFAYLVRPETVGQLTGLKDKNGKEIYEGDIVKCTSRILTNFGKTDTGKVDICYRQVIWKDDSWGYRVVKKGEVGYGVGFESKGIKILTEFGEVVGNCYENPEILQG